MNEHLTNRQIAFVIFGIVVGYGVINLPKNVAESAGTGGWFSILIGTAVAIVFTYIIAYLGYVHKNKTIYEYSEMLTGKIVTSIFMSIYCIYFFMFFTMIIRMTSETIKLTILLRTPVWVLSLVFFVAVYYAVTKKLQVIARICEIYGLIIIIAAIIINIGVFSKGKLVNVRPFFVLEDIQTYIKASVVTIFPFIGLEILTIIPFNKKENNKKIFKYSIFMIGAIGLLYVSAYEACIAVMGVDSIIHYKAAVLATIRRVDIPSLQFLRRLDGIFIIIWIMSIFCTLILCAYGSIFLISKLIKKISFNKIAFFVIIIAFIVSQVPGTIDQIQTWLDYIGYSSVFTIVIIPITLLIITKVKKYDKKI